MTVAVSIKVNDGVVLAADSASTVTTTDAAGNVQLVNVYNNANKIFNLYEGLPIGGITWGLGNIGTASIATLAKDLRARLMGDDPAWKIDPHAYTVEDVANKARRFLYDEHYLPAFGPNPPNDGMGFIVAGYSPGEPMAEEYQLTIGQGIYNGPSLLRPKHETGMTWNGQGEAITRLVLGFGTQLAQVLQQNLGVAPAQLEPAMQVIRQALQITVIVPAMPFQDAIDLAEFLVDLTIKFARFTPSVPVVGGPIEIAGISKHEGFKWIRRKHYYDAALN